MFIGQLHRVHFGSDVLNFTEHLLEDFVITCPLMLTSLLIFLRKLGELSFVPPTYFFRVS